MDAEETRKKYPSLPGNYVSLLQLQQIRLKERQQQQQKQKEEQGEEQEEERKSCPQSQQTKLPFKNQKRRSQQTKSYGLPSKNCLQINVPGQEEKTQQSKETDGKQLPQQQNVDESNGEQESKKKTKQSERKRKKKKKKKKKKPKPCETLAGESTELGCQEMENPKLPPSRTTVRKESLSRCRKKGKNPLPRDPVPETNRIVQKIHDLKVVGDKMLGEDYWRASGRSRGTLMWVPKEENSGVNPTGSR